MTRITIPGRIPVRCVFDLKRAGDDRYRHLNRTNRDLSTNLSLIYFSVANIATTYLVDLHTMLVSLPCYRQRLKQADRRAMSLMEAYERAVRRSYLTEDRWVNNLDLTDAVMDRVRPVVEATKESLVILFTRQLPDRPDDVRLLVAAYMAGMFLTISENTFKNFVGQASEEAAHDFRGEYGRFDLRGVLKAVGDVIAELCRAYPRWRPQHIIDSPAIRANRDILFRRMQDTDLYTEIIRELEERRGTSAESITDK